MNRTSLDWSMERTLQENRAVVQVFYPLCLLSSSLYLIFFFFPLKALLWPQRIPIISHASSKIYDSLRCMSFSGQGKLDMGREQLLLSGSLWFSRDQCPDMLDSCLKAHPVLRKKICPSGISLLSLRTTTANMVDTGGNLFLKTRGGRHFSYILPFAWYLVPNI